MSIIAPRLAVESLLAGIPVVTSSHLREDQAFVMNSGPAAKVVVGVRRLTEVELAGRWAQWFVRRGFADAGLLPDGIEVGTEPTADNVSLLATLRAEVPR